MSQILIKIKPTDTLEADVGDDTKEFRERLLRVLIGAVFLLFFQTFMVAPLIPTLAVSLHRKQEEVGLLIPAYTLPYAFAALVCGVVADRFGRRGILFASLIAFPILCVAMAFAPGLEGLLLMRVISGLTNAGITVMGLSLIGDLFPIQDRGRAIGWVFGAIAGGGAFGSTLGGLLAPTIGWRGLFIVVAVAGVIAVAVAKPLWSKLFSTPTSKKINLSLAAGAYLTLLRSPRGARTYGYILMNGVFHSGVFTWLSVLLHDRFGLGEVGIGLALLGYGVPGLFLGPVIGKIVDRKGRRQIIPIGMAIAAASALLLAPSLPLAISIAAITLLSLGLDMTHPLFAGIATTLDDKRRGQAMGLNTFSLFLGFGLGSLVFGALLRWGMPTALLTFAAVQAVLAVLSARLFQAE